MYGNSWIDAGTFELLSGMLAIGDPSLPTLDEEGVGALVEARPGSWHVSYAQIGAAPAAVQAVHGFVAADALHWIEADQPLVVDSGQVGVIDERFYRPDDDRWSIRCRRLTSTHPFAGIFPAGAVSATYFAKGSYPLLLARGVDDRVLGVRVLFIDPLEQLADVAATDHRGSIVEPQRGFELVPYAVS